MIPTTSSRLARAASRATIAALLAVAPALAAAHAGHDHGKAATAPAAPSATAPAPVWETAMPRIPDVTVRDQTGRTLQFHRDLIKGRKVAINFVFTSCTSICTPLAATFRAMQEQMAKRGIKDVHLISVSVDPLTDTPDALRRFGEKFGAEPGWTFVTGSRKSIDQILRAFGVATGDPNDHSPIVWVGDDAQQRWTRTLGLSAPDAILERVASLRGPAATSAPAAPRSAVAAPAAAASAATAVTGGSAPAAVVPSAAGAAPRAAKGERLGAKWFTNLPLRAHDGRHLRFYDDLLRDRIVVLNSFFASCKDVCSPMTFNLAQVQAQLDPKVAREVSMVSISVDPVNDTPEVLAAYAARHGAKPGWTLVTGKKENVDWVLHKLGLYNESKDDHLAALWVGNERTGHWLKLHAMSPPSAIITAVNKVRQGDPS
jgi:cytochrome oxidase Cu insertion factor (SCO1/SenC/PrrC family)